MGDLYSTVRAGGRHSARYSESGRRSRHLPTRRSSGPHQLASGRGPGRCGVPGDRAKLHPLIEKTKPPVPEASLRLLQVPSESIAVPENRIPLGGLTIYSTVTDLARFLG